MGNPSYAETRPAELTKMLGEGLPEGRCTAFIGGRGGHKSHLGYLHVLHRIKEHEEAALIVSLRDDEMMTRSTLAGILAVEWPNVPRTDSCHSASRLRTSNNPQLSKSECDVKAQQRRPYLDELKRLECNDQLEILYFHPGNITPEEFFHRMFLSLWRMRQTLSKVTVLFNSLDQLGVRFPLCAKQEIFVPGMIEALSGEAVTSLFIAVSEKGHPVEHYGLLPMADLILSFERVRFDFRQYYDALRRGRKFEGASQRCGKAPAQPSKRHGKGPREEIVVQVLRFAGGERAGKRGLLELVKKDELSGSLYPRPGLHFTELSLGDIPQDRPRSELVSGG